MTKHPPPILCQKTRANLKSKERENSALFFVKGQEETKVNKRRKQCTVLCQGMRGEKIVHCSLSRDERRLRSIKRENSALFLSSSSRDERRLRSIKIENSALFFVKGRALFFVRDERRLRSIKRENSALFFVKG